MGSSVTLKICGAKIEPKIGASLSDTILEVKEILASRLGIAAFRQKLSYNGTHLDNDGTLESCEFDDDDDDDDDDEVELKLEVKPLPTDCNIKIEARNNYSGKTKTIKVCENDTVGELKKKIAKKMGTSHSLLNLSCHGEKMSDNDDLLSEYYVSGETVIEVAESKYV